MMLHSHRLIVQDDRHQNVYCDTSNKITVCAFNNTYTKRNFARLHLLAPTPPRGSSPAVVRSPVTGDRNELQKELNAGQFVEDLCRLPVQTRRRELDQELHHFHHLLMGVGASLRTFEQEKTFQHHPQLKPDVSHFQPTKQKFSFTQTVKISKFNSIH